MKYIEQGGDEFKTKKNMKALLQRLDKAESLYQKVNANKMEPGNKNKEDRGSIKNNEQKRDDKNRNTSNNDNNKNKKDNDKEKQVSAKCRMPGHDHVWSQYPNNPFAKNFNGTHFRDVWKREEKQNKKEVNAITKRKEVKFSNIDGYDSESEYSYNMTEKSEDGVKETAIHPETIITIPTVPGSKSSRTVRVLLDMCATGSFLDSELVDKEFSEYKGTKYWKN